MTAQYFFMFDINFYEFSFKYLSLSFDVDISVDGCISIWKAYSDMFDMWLDSDV